MSRIVEKVLILGFPVKGKAFANLTHPTAGGYRLTRVCLGNVCGAVRKKWEGFMFPSVPGSDCYITNPIMAPDGMYADVEVRNDDERGNKLFEALGERRVKFDPQYSWAMESKGEISAVVFTHFIADVIPKAAEVEGIRDLLNNDG